jgi:hypothetical protein
LAPASQAFGSAPDRLVVAMGTGTGGGTGPGPGPALALALVPESEALELVRAREVEQSISPCLGAHEAHPKTTLYGVVFQKLNGPLLTSARIASDGCNASSLVCRAGNN